MKELSQFLQNKGHGCIRIIGLKDHEFEWCQKDECPAKKIEII